MGFELTVAERERFSERCEVDHLLICGTTRTLSTLIKGVIDVTMVSMEVRIAAMADFANVDAGGKLNIIGVYNEVASSFMPLSIPMIYLALAFTASVAEVGVRKKIELKFLSQDGDELVVASTELVIPQPSRPGSKVNLVQAIGVGNLRLDSGGDYHWAILIDGDEKSTIPIYVKDLSEEADTK